MHRHAAPAMTVTAPASATATAILPPLHRCTACPARIHHAPPPFRFLDLPPEIRTQIADLVILSPGQIVIHEPRFNRHASPPPLRRAPGSRPRFDRPVLLPSQSFPSSLPTPPMSRNGSTDSERQHAHSHGNQASEEPRQTIRPRRRAPSKDIGHTRLALLLTCRTLYAAHWRSYYARNRFFFPNLDTLQGFTAELPRRCVAAVRKAGLKMPHWLYNDRVWRLLAELEGMENLEIWLRGPVLGGGLESLDRGECVEGVRGCKRLRTVRLRREELEESADDVAAPATVGGEDNGGHGTDEGGMDLDDTASPEVVIGPTAALAAMPHIGTGAIAIATTVVGDGIPNGNDEEEEGEEATEERQIERVLAEDRRVEGRINAYLGKRLERRRERAELKKRQGEEKQKRVE